MPALASVPKRMSRPKLSIRRMSSVLLVDRIEPCLEFWVDRLGFEIRLQVHGEDHLEFVALERDEVEVLYRTRDSLHTDTMGLVTEDAHQPWVVIYLEVDDLDELMDRMDGVEIVVPVRETILGNREVFLREPSGRILAISSRV